MQDANGPELFGLLSEELPDVSYQQNTDATDREFQVAMGGVVDDLARNMGLGRKTLTPMDQLPGGVLGKAYKRLQELQARQQELEGTVQGATTVTGVKGTEAGPEITGTQITPAPRYNIQETAEGFEVLDESSGQPLGIFGTTEEADAFKESLRPTKQSRKKQPDVEEPISEQDEMPDGPVSLFDEQNDSRSYEMFSLSDEQAENLMRNRLNAPDLKDGVIGGIRAIGAAGDDKLRAEGNIVNLIGEMATTIRDKVDQKNLETLATEEQLEMADLIGSDPKRLLESMKRGFNIDITQPGALGAHLMAAKTLLRNEFVKLDRLSDVAVNGTLEDKLRWKEQADLVANIQAMYKGAQTNIARSLSLLRSPVRNFEGLADNEIADITKRDMSRIAEKYGGEESLDAAIDAYRKADDPADRLEIVAGGNRARKYFNAWHEVWINSILSGPWTHVKNMAGGLAAILNDDTEDIFAAATGKFTGNNSITFGDVKAKAFGQMMSQQEALAAMGKGFRTREELFGSSKLDFRSTGDGGRIATSQQYDGFSPEALGTEGDGAASFVRIAGNIATMGRWPTRALVAGDSYVKMVAYRGSLYEQAYRQSRLEDLQGDDQAEFIANFLFNPPTKAIEKAEKLAREVTLQTELSGGLKNIHRTLKGPVARWLVPFFTTPTNALLYMRDRTVFYRATEKYRQAIKEGGAAAEKAKAQWKMGTAIMGAVLMYALTDQENITGNISSDQRVVDAYKRQGIKRYSIRIPGTDGYVPYNIVEPISSIIGIAVDVAEVVKSSPEMEDREVWELICAAIGTVGYNVSNKSYMVGVSQFMEALQDPKRRAVRFVKNYAASALLPGSQLLDQTQRVIDNTQKFRRDVLDNIQAKLPGFSSSLPPQRDAWGRVTMRHRAYSPYNPNEVDAELMRSRYGWGRYPTQESKDFRYTEKETDYFHEQTGQQALKLMKKYLKTRAFKKLKKASEAGNVMATEELHKEYGKIRMAAQKFGRAKLYRHPEFGPALRAAQKELRDYNRSQAQQLREDMQ